MKKNSRTPINPKKYSCYGLKKVHTRNVIRKKNFCGSKIPPPPITFLMVRPLQSPESTPPTVSDIHDAQNHGTTEVRHNRPMKMKTNRTQFKCRYQL